MLARIAVLIAFLFSTTLYANNHTEALTGLQNATETILKEVSENRETFTNDRVLLFNVVNDIVREQFDLERMSRLAMGKLWRRASENEKTTFIDQFSILIVKTYSTTALNYTNQDISWRIGTEDNHGRITVTAKVKNDDGISIQIQFKMAKSNRYEGWRAYDVSIEGISIVMGYRSVFADQERKIGISGIIDELYEKNKKLFEHQH